MKKLFALLFVAVSLVGCNSKVEIGPIALGDNYNEAYGRLVDLNIPIVDMDSDYIQIESDIELFGVIFDKGNLTFKNDKLSTFAVKRNFSTLSSSKFKQLVKKVEEIFGEAQRIPDNMTSNKSRDFVVFEKKIDNFQAGLVFDWEYDELCVVIREPIN